MAAGPARAAGLVRIGLDDRPDEPPGTPVSDLLELPHLEDVSGEVVFLREPDGDLAGIGWRRRDGLRAYVAPDRPGRNLEALVLAGLRAADHRA